MAAKMCPSHLARRATSTCRRCGRPICDLCESETGGRFCSTPCAAAFGEFQSQVADEFRVRRTLFSLLGCLRSAVISAILLVVIWVALVYLLGTSDPAEMISALKKILRLVF